MSKSAEAFRTISEVAADLDVPKHVLRFWEGKFPQVKPMKRGGGRRYYRPEDVELLRGIRHLLHSEGYTIKGVQKILREQGVEKVKGRAEAPASARAGRSRPVPRKATSGHATSGGATGGGATGGVTPRGAAGARGRTRGESSSKTPSPRRSERQPGRTARAAQPHNLNDQQLSVLEAVVAELERCRELLAGRKSGAPAKATGSRKKRA